jgi:16S rRNA (uracil1498-N3)-methyltransferase
MHIAKTLRMRPGETLILCDGKGLDGACTILKVSSGSVEVRVDAVFPNRAEPPIRVVLLCGYPKADRAEHIAQKAVELGAAEIVFFLSERSVARPDDFTKKRERLERIVREAAMQSGRGVIPPVRGLLSEDEAFREAAGYTLPLFFFEHGGEALRTLPMGTDAALVTGPEGGFSDAEVERARAMGLRVASLGPRILRCETAPLAALAAVLYASGAL